MMLLTVLRIYNFVPDCQTLCMQGAPLVHDVVLIEIACNGGTG